jgi:hypothetical protein
MRVRLEGITLRGKNKVRQHGAIWNVLEINPRVECLGGKMGYYIESLADTDKTPSGREKSRRWVALPNDEDFKVELITQ